MYFYLCANFCSISFKMLYSPWLNRKQKYFKMFLDHLLCRVLVYIWCIMIIIFWLGSFTFLYFTETLGSRCFLFLFGTFYLFFFLSVDLEDVNFSLDFGPHENYSSGRGDLSLPLTIWEYYLSHPISFSLLTKVVVTPQHSEAGLVLSVLATFLQLSISPFKTAKLTMYGFAVFLGSHTL